MFYQTGLGCSTRSNMNWKDNFSTQAESYAKYRPHYPVALYDFLRQQVKYQNAAWDCGTGNGQVATELAKFFKQVWATDASHAQLVHAPNLPNVHYSVAWAEKSGLATQSIDLITVAQAVHWFDFDKFYQEVHRVARREAIIALWGYGLLSISTTLDQILGNFYHEVVGQYWDAERKHLDHQYQTIPFPFKTVPTPVFTMSVTWDLAELGCGKKTFRSSISDHSVSIQNRAYTRLYDVSYVGFGRFIGLFGNVVECAENAENSSG